MIARSTLLIVIAFAALAALPALAETLLRDDFSAALGRYEFIGGRMWQVRDGAFRFNVPAEGFAVANLDELSEARIESTLTIVKRQGHSYITAGLTFFLDAENHWRLLLVASPQDKPYFELIERFQGVHQAQSAPPPAGTQLASKDEGDLTAWEYGKPYRLTLTISPKEIVGEVRDPASGRFWRRTYSFASGRALHEGRPGLCANGVEGGFQSLLVEGVRPPAAPALSVARGEAGSVAILRDETNKLAPALQDLFAKSGFGVAILDWDDLNRGRLPAGELDLFVLADARRLPTIAAKRVLSFLRARGKVIAVGAPAFGELLVKSPKGYVTQERYGESVYEGLAKQPLALPATAWKRSAKDPKRSATINEERVAQPPSAVPAGVPAGAAPAWKVTADLDGWDTFGQTIEKGFPSGHGLLCFRARGDAETPQLSIECRERDGARWIATVALAADWRVYVLRPYNFAFWHDSKAKRGAGDRMNPQNVSEIDFGLSGSHTPKCKPGPHTFWLADVATAADPNVEEPEAYVPDIEGLCPSYKLYPMWETKELRIAECGLRIDKEELQISFSGKGYSPVWREGGSGFDRNRPWRWVRVLDALDADGRNRGALLSFMIGNNVFPGAIWANVGLADLEDLPRSSQPQVRTPLEEALVALAKTMTRGCFLLEGGARYFSCHEGEKLDLGALVVNSGRAQQTLTVDLAVADRNDKVVYQKACAVTVPPGERRTVTAEWKPPAHNARSFPYTVTTKLLPFPEPRALSPEPSTIHTISHAVELLASEPAKPEEFVKVEGSNFMLGGKPWHMLGINYRPSSMGGHPLLGQQTRRDCHDPAIVERDLSWMESIGINMLSAIQALVPDDPEAPGAYRDQQDFLNRCRHHNMKVFYFLFWGNPMANADVAKIKQHIEAAGIKDHPAILAWELAWEPIYYSGPVKKGNMEFLVPDWNAWIVERYGSVEEAEKDWGFGLDRVAQPPSAVPKERTPEGGRATQGLVALPRQEWCNTHGDWDRAVAAFRRFFSDRVGRAYGDVIRELHRWDPKHLVTFRFGACGIPDKARFAHAHSAAVAKHVDFLCPEGYNLQTGGWAKPTPPDNLRKGGLVTLYYRFLSREKPVVWMEFGYTVNGFHTEWKTGLEHIKPEELALQRVEYDSFYKMFIESGARGAAPWWLPGGFRLGENSDFGVLEPDGVERPACQVLREYLPKFAQVKPRDCVLPQNVLPETGRVIALDFDAHYADAWETYSAQYLEAVKAGELPYLRTAGTGTTSADCPLLAVGDVPCTGKNPPQFLNAEFNSLELKAGHGDWKAVRNGEVFTAKKGAKVLCRASVGNTAEATWVAPGGTPEGGRATRLQPGAVYLACADLCAPLAADTPYLKDGAIAEFALSPSEAREQKLAFQLVTSRKKADSAETMLLPFGEKWTITLKTED